MRLLVRGPSTLLVLAQLLSVCRSLVVHPPAAAFHSRGGAPAAVGGEACAGGIPSRCRGPPQCALTSGGGNGPPAGPPPEGGVLRDLRGLWGRLVAAPSSEATDQELERDLQPAAPEDLEYVPLVLVVGATGRMGRIIVRKLVMQGFRVSVLVRSLGTDTLNLLGSGVSYSYGDMTDYRSLLDAMEDVDRVIFAADTADEQEELRGLSQVMRSFQDTRTFMYGDAEATKLTLLKMRRDRDFNRWQVETASDQIAGRLASAGIGPQPSVTYWKRSPTGAHRNGVFVGKVFDTYLGSAVVTCSLSGLLVGGAPVSDAAATALSGGAARPKQLSAAGNEGPADTTLEGHTSNDGELDREIAAAAAAEVPLDLGQYSGLVLRAIGDSKQYTVVLRTPEFAQSGIEYQADFTSTTSSFATVRLPFSKFVAVRDGRKVVDAPELDRRNLVVLGLAFFPQRNNPSQTDGEFYLSLANVKAYRKRDEPEFIYISDASVESSEQPADADEDHARRVKRAGAKRQGEAMVKASGLTYFIVRPTELTDNPSSRRLAFTQGDSTGVRGSVARADVAEVAVRSLLDPRACNVACTLTESDAIAPSPFEQDISKALEVLEPNR